MKWVARALKKHAVYRLMSALLALGLSPEVFASVECGGGNLWLPRWQDFNERIEVARDQPLYSIWVPRVVLRSDIRVRCSGAPGAVEVNVVRKSLLPPPIGSMVIDGVEHEIYPTSWHAMGLAIATQFGNKGWRKGYSDNISVPFTNGSINTSIVTQTSYAYVKVAHFPNDHAGWYDPDTINHTIAGRVVIQTPDGNELHRYPSTKQIRGGIIKVHSLVCSVFAPIVHMGDQRSADIGSPSSMRDVTVSINGCPHEIVSAKYRIDGNRVGDLALGLLSLDNLGAGSASGIALQLLKEDGVTPFAFGVDHVVEGYAPGSHSYLRFKARYYRIAGPVSNGVANASATITMTYQ